MGHRPPLLRLLAALILALGLMGSFVTPSLAQDDGTPVAEEPVTEEPAQSETDETTEPEQPVDEEQTDEEVAPAAEGLGSLVVLYYLCDGGDGFGFEVGVPGEGPPNPLVDDCAPSDSVDGTDRTFYVYLFGDTSSTPLELTTIDGVIQDDTLPVTDGTPHLITNQLIVVEPVEENEEAVEEAAEEEPPIEATFEILEEQLTGVTATQFQTGSLELHKFTCPGDPTESKFDILNPGELFDDSAYGDCVQDNHAFTITPFDNEDEFGTITLETVDGLATIDEIATTSLASGPHKIVEDGVEIVGVFDIEPNTNTVITAINYEEVPEESGSLTITKYTCPSDVDTETDWYVDETPDNQEFLDTECALTEVTFSIYLYGDLQTEPINASTDENGVADVTDLPVTTESDPHVIVEDATGSETSFDIAPESTTSITVVNYETVVIDDEGTLELDVLACTGIDESLMIVGDPGDDSANIPSSCYGDFARFVIYPFGDQGLEPVQIDVTEFETIDLPVTDGSPHLIIELDGAGVPMVSGLFEIEANQFTPIQVRNPTYGSVTIYSFICEGTSNSTFDVYNPGQSATLPADCDFLERDFTITLFGSGASTTVSTGGDGIVGLSGLPTTNTAKHIIAKSSGVTASFEVDEGRDTVIVSISWQENGGVIDDDNDSENVGEISDTGVGPLMPAGGGSAITFGLLSLGTLLVAGMALRKRAA